MPSGSTDTLGDIETIRNKCGPRFVRSDNLPEPDELAGEIIENVEAGLNSFREVLGSLRA